MTNPPNAAGPSNPITPGKSSEPIKPGTDKFRDYMKVRESEEKQKKKKKRSEETSEEKKAALQGLPTLPEEKVEPIHKKSSKHAKMQKAKEQVTRSSEEAAPPPLPPQEEAAALSPEPEEEPIPQTPIQEKTKPQEPTPPKHAPIQPPASTPLGLSFLTPTSELPPAYTLLPAPILALFEKMVSTIIVLQNSGITETTVHLSTQEFANTPFTDAHIIIRQYSTAPLTYNIELVGNPEAVSLFQQNLPALQAAFHDKRYRFQVGRLETSHTKSAVRRVERKSDVE